jgi:hypothetical protein
MRNRIGRPRFMQSFTSAGGGPFLATPPSDGETYGVRNGEQWVEVCEEAPKNGTLYGRISNAWQPIPSGGDPGTASGVLFTPAGNISATNVQAAIQELDNEKVAKAGGANAIMTGFLTLHADPDAPLKAATKQYVDNLFNNAGVTVGDAAPTPNQGKLWWESDTGVLWMSYTDASSTQWISVGGTQAAISDASKADKTYVDAQDALKADKTYVDAQNTTQNATISAKADTTYVDTQDALKVAKLGDTMSGDLNITSTTPSTTTTTGALKVAGGVGINGKLYVGGAILTGVKGNQLGINGGVAGSAVVASSDANILLYNSGGANWAGLGADAGGNLWIRAGLSGTPLPAINVFASDQSVRVQSAAASTSPSTGALVVTGGVGINGAVSAASDVTITKDTPRLVLNHTGATAAPGINGQINGVTRWTIQMGNVAANNDFFVTRAGFDNPFRISSTTGTVSLELTTASTSPTTGALVVAGGVGINGALNATAIAFSNAGTLQWSIYNNPPANSYVISDADATHGVYLLQNSNTWTALSDRRMAHKQNARTVSGLLDRLDKFRLVEFGEDEIGVLAQELYDFVPRLVVRGDDDDRIIRKITESGVWGVKPSEAAFVALQVAKEIWEDVDRRLTQLETHV